MAHRETAYQLEVYKNAYFGLMQRYKREVAGLKTEIWALKQKVSRLQGCDCILVENQVCDICQGTEKLKDGETL